MNWLKIVVDNVVVQRKGVLLSVRRCKTPRLPSLALCFLTFSLFCSVVLVWELFSCVFVFNYYCGE